MRFNLLVDRRFDPAAELATADDRWRFLHAASHLADVWPYAPGTLVNAEEWR